MDHSQIQQHSRLSQAKSNMARLRPWRYIIPATARTARCALRPVPESIPKPNYYKTGDPGPPPHLEPILGADEIERAVEANRLAAKTLKYASSLLRPGLTTRELDASVHEYIVAHKA